MKCAFAFAFALSLSIGCGSRTPLATSDDPPSSGEICVARAVKDVCTLRIRGAFAGTAPTHATSIVPRGTGFEVFSRPVGDARIDVLHIDISNGGASGRGFDLPVTFQNCAWGSDGSHLVGCC